MLGKGRMAGAVGGDDRTLKAWIISSVMCFMASMGDNTWNSRTA